MLPAKGGLNATFLGLEGEWEPPNAADETYIFL